MNNNNDSKLIEEKTERADYRYAYTLTGDILSVEFQNKAGAGVGDNWHPLTPNLPFTYNSTLRFTHLIFEYINNNTVPVEITATINDSFTTLEGPLFSGLINSTNMWLDCLLRYPLRVSAGQDLRFWIRSNLILDYGTRTNKGTINMIEEKNSS